MVIDTHSHSLVDSEAQLVYLTLSGTERRDAIAYSGQYTIQMDYMNHWGDVLLETLPTEVIIPVSIENPCYKYILIAGITLSKTEFEYWIKETGKTIIIYQNDDEVTALYGGLYDNASSDLCGPYTYSLYKAGESGGPVEFEETLVTLNGEESINFEDIDPIHYNPEAVTYFLGS